MTTGEGGGPALVLGPMLRYVSETEATIWVETDRECRVEVLGRTAPTFEVAGHHYGLVVLEGLAPGSAHEYQVALDGTACWPPPDSGFPPSVLRTLAADRPARLAFGSCRVAEIAFENLGRPDPDPAGGAIAIGGHGGELLRGGYAKLIPGSAARRAAASAEMFRRLTMRRVPLLRARGRAAYLTSLTPWVAAVAARPGPALDDFYLVNRAGRWSAAARQAYALRSVLAQPFFDDQVVRAARAVPLAERLDDRLVYGAIGALHPPLQDIPLAADHWKCAPARSAAAAAPPAPATTPGRRASFDWRRGYGDEVAVFLRDYVLAASGLFTVVSRPAAEKLLRLPHTDPVTVWALATLATLASGDWLNARDPAGQTFAIPVPA